MNRHERRKQAAKQRQAARQGSVSMMMLEGPARERFRAELKSEESIALFSQICRLLYDWHQDNPHAVLEWHSDEKLLIVGPLGEPEAQRLLAKNDAAMALLEWLDEQTGGAASTVHARYALEYVGMIETTARVEAGRMVRSYAEKSGRITRMPDSPCPFCGLIRGGASAGTDAIPKPGQPTICVSCGGFGCFADDLTMRRMTEAEMNDWAERAPDSLAAAHEASSLFRLAALRAKAGP